jgi:MFS family permease
MSHAEVSTAQRWTPRLWAVLVVVCGALFLDGLDSAMVGVAVPSIRHQFAVAPSTVQWVISAYVLGFGGFLLLAGRLADVVGRRRILIAGVLLLLFSSAVGTAAGAIVWVIVARFAMGVGAALTAPAGLSIIVTSFPEGPQRGRAIGIYTACGAVGFSAGLIGGGVLSSLGWRWVFGLSVLMAALVWVGAQWIVPRDAPMTGPRPSLGLASSVTITGAMLTLVYLIVDVPAAGWASARTLTAAGVFVLLLVAFRMAERSAREPLFASAVLRGGNLVSAALFSAAIMGSYTSFQFISALYLQQNRGWTPWAMAFGFLPLSVLVAIIGPRVGRLIQAVGTRKVIALGFAVYVVAYVQFLRLDDSSPYWSVVLPTVLLIGFAFPLSFTGAYVQAATGVPDRDQGFASAVAQTGYQIGSALVLAVVTVVITPAAGTNTGELVPVHVYRHGLYIVAGVAAAALLLAVARVLTGRRDDVPGRR